jgi:hypothetical protein
MERQINMRRLMVILLIALCFNGITQAQNASLPLVLEVDGDIWTWKAGDAALTRLTEWGYNSDLAVSPDGTQVAYYSLAQIVVEAIERDGGFGGGKLPGNIWVMETTTGEAYRAADQPAGASFFTPGVPDKAIVRSTPMWSPDGSKLAWTEYDYADEMNNPFLRLVVFDTVSKTAQVIADDVPFPAGVPAAMNGDWTEAGIFLYHYMADPNTGNLSNALLVYSPDGTRLNELFYGETPDRIVAMAVPVMYQNQTYLAALMLTIASNQREWQMIDPLEAGATWQPAPAVPERVARLNPNNSLRLMWSRPPAAENYPDTATIIEDGTPVNFDLASGTWIFQPALSPDGKSVAFTIFDPQAGAHDPSVYVWDSQDDALLSVPVNPESFVHQIVWGAMVWEIRP